MPSFLADNAHYLLLAVIGFWFTARFLVMPGRGRGGLAGLLKRESRVKEGGLDTAAIRTLVEDSRAFARQRPDIRGLLLAGEFAAGTAQPASTVVLVFLAERIADFAKPDDIAGWPYTTRGHPVLSHEANLVEHGVALHRLSLRGAPPVLLAFLAVDGQALPASLEAAVRIGCLVLDDPSGRAQALRQAWREAPSA